MIEGRAPIGYDHDYDAQKYYLRLALDPKCVEGFIEGCLKRIGDDETLVEDLWKGESEKETMLMILQAECELL